MSLNTTLPLFIKFGDVTIPVRPTLVKKAKASGERNTYWTVLNPVNAQGERTVPFAGVKVPAFGATLPGTVTLIDQDGTEIVLSLTAKADTYKDRDTGKMVARANKAVGVSQKVLLSGEDKMVSVSVSDIGEGRNNLTVSVNGISGGGTGAKAAPVAISDL